MTKVEKRRVKPGFIRAVKGVAGIGMLAFLTATGEGFGAAAASGPVGIGLVTAYIGAAIHLISRIDAEDNE